MRSPGATQPAQSAPPAAGEAPRWRPGDVLAVPSWCAVDHEPAETAELFVLSDAPVLEALRLERTEVLNEPQAVTGSWSGG